MRSNNFHICINARKCSLWSSVRAYNSRYLANKHYFLIELTQNILLSVMNSRRWFKVWHFGGVWYLSGGSLDSASSSTWTCLWTSRTRLNTEGLKDRQEQGNNKPHNFPTMKNNICSFVQFLNEMKSRVITNVLKRLRQWISSCEWQLKNESIPQTSFCIATTAGYLVTSMATVVALETDPSSTVNGGSGEALKSSLIHYIRLYIMVLNNKKKHKNIQ